MVVGKTAPLSPAQSTRARAFTGASILLHETPCGLAKIGDGHEAVVVGFARDADHAPDSVRSPANQEGAYEVLGVGTISCEVWTKNRADKSNDRNFINGAWIKATLLPLMSSAMVRAI